MSWSTIRYRDFMMCLGSSSRLTTGNNIFAIALSMRIVNDYSERYTVYQLPSLSEDELQGSWEHFPERAASVLGKVPVAQVQFDTTKRNSIDKAVLAEMIVDRDPQSTLVA